jgi:exopolysaccharide biosynthesis WecB/TagA/CpsF family protein
VLVMTHDQALAELRRAIQERTAGIWAFCNAHMVNVAQELPEFRKVLAGARIFNDGIGLNVASKILYGAPFVQNLNGTDFTPELLGSFTEPTNIFLLGSAPGVAEQAAEVLSTRYPNVRCVGTQHGFFASEEEPEIARRIVTSGADLVLAGMGNPVQELWAARNVEAIGAPLLCIGAFIDFTAGRVRRAPDWVRALQVEWLYRLAQEPRRLGRRYLIGNITFLVTVLRQKRIRG